MKSNFFKTKKGTRAALFSVCKHLFWMLTPPASSPVTEPGSRNVPYTRDRTRERTGKVLALARRRPGLTVRKGPGDPLLSGTQQVLTEPAEGRGQGQAWAGPGEEGEGRPHRSQVHQRLVGRDLNSGSSALQASTAVFKK